MSEKCIMATFLFFLGNVFHPCFHPHLPEKSSQLKTENTNHWWLDWCFLVLQSHVKCRKKSIPKMLWLSQFQERCEFTWRFHPLRCRISWTLEKILSLWNCPKQDLFETILMLTFKISKNCYLKVNTSNGTSLFSIGIHHCRAFHSFEIPSCVNYSDRWFHKRILRKERSPTNQEAVFQYWKRTISSHVCFKILILIYVLLIPTYENELCVSCVTSIISTWQVKHTLYPYLIGLLIFPIPGVSPFFLSNRANPPSWWFPAKVFTVHNKNKESPSDDNISGGGYFTNPKKSRDKRIQMRFLLDLRWMNT